MNINQFQKYYIAKHNNNCKNKGEEKQGACSSGLSNSQTKILSPTRATIDIGQLTGKPSYVVGAKRRCRLSAW